MHEIIYEHKLLAVIPGVLSANGTMFFYVREGDDYGEFLPCVVKIYSSLGYSGNTVLLVTFEVKK